MINDSQTISVIVPVYKVEKYLDACIESIVNQTYRELEIILVDDGSPDGCPGMCDAWAKKDSRIKVIHKENGGGAAARNDALDIACGDYIAFVDSDDIIHPKMYEILYSVLTENNCDIAECSYQTEYPLNENNFNNVVAVYDNREAVKEYICGKNCNQLIWNKLYKRKTVENVRFVPGKMIDDEFFTYRAIANSEKTVIIDSKLYYYRQQEDSVMHRHYSLKRLAAVEAKVGCAGFIASNYPEFFNEANANAAGSCIYNGQMSLKYLSNEDKKTAFKFLGDTYKSCGIRFKDLEGKKFKHKIWYMIANVSLELCCRLRNILNIGF